MKKRITTTLAVLLVAGCASEGPKGNDGPTGYTGSLAIAPDPVQFEDTRVGCGRSVTLTLENTAPDHALTITDATLPSRALAVSAAFPLELAPGASRTLDLQFAPTTAGAASGTLDFATDEEAGTPYRLSVAARGLANDAPADPAAVGPLDLVFVLDVSTTMDELASLHGAMAELFDTIAADGLDARFGLTTFVNDVIVHRRGAFLDRQAFFDEFDSQLRPDTWVPNEDLPRQLTNFDFPENSLEALYRSATDFDFRPGSRRYILLLTDASFLESPAVFSDGTPALHSYAEVADALRERRIRLLAIHASRAGRGFSSRYEGQPSLVAATGGRWFELADVSSGALSLETVLGDLLVAPVCD